MKCAYIQKYDAQKDNCLYPLSIRKMSKCRKNIGQLCLIKEATIF